VPNQFDIVSFLSFVQGDSYPGLCAQRMLRVEDFICGGDDRGPEPVSFFLCVIGGHVRRGSTYPFGMSGPYQKRETINK